jgi:hypothetical protein
MSRNMCSLCVKASRHYSLALKEEKFQLPKMTVLIGLYYRVIIFSSLKEERAFQIFGIM